MVQFWVVKMKYEFLKTNVEEHTDTHRLNKYAHSRYSFSTVFSVLYLHTLFNCPQNAISYISYQSIPRFTFQWVAPDEPDTVTFT
jgi:hypothetical protein